jgi:hypothetical protein
MVNKIALNQIFTKKSINKNLNCHHKPTLPSIHHFFSTTYKKCCNFDMSFLNSFASRLFETSET